MTPSLARTETPKWILLEGSKKKGAAKNKANDKHKKKDNADEPDSQGTVGPFGGSGFDRGHLLHCEAPNEQEARLIESIVSARIPFLGTEIKKKNPDKKKKTKKAMEYPGTSTRVVSGQEWAQQNMAGKAQFQPYDLRYLTQPVESLGVMNLSNGSAPQLPAVQGCNVASKSSCSNGPEPAAYWPYAGGTGAASFDASYPNEEDMSSLAPRGCPTSQQAGYALNVNSLMPAGWRNDTGCGADTSTMDGSQWAKYAPTKDAFNRYITAQGSARLTLNTRNPLGRQVGIPDLLRQGAPMPLPAEQIVFNDSSYRLDAIFRQLGRYPTSTVC